MISLVALLVISCEEKPITITTNLRGKLMAANSYRVLPDARIYLVHAKAQGYTFRDIILDSTRSDSLGNYNFRFDVSSNNSEGLYQLVCYYPGYYSTRETNPFPTKGWDKHFNVGGDQVYNPELSPYAWVRIQCDLDNSFIRLDINPTFGEYEGPIILHPGQKSIILKTKGNAWNNISHFLYRDNGDYYALSDSIYCGNNDTTTFIINY